MEPGIAVPFQVCSLENDDDERPEKSEPGSDDSSTEAADVRPHGVAAARHLDDDLLVKDFFTRPLASFVLGLVHPRVSFAVVLAWRFHPGGLILGLDQLEGQADEVERKREDETEPVEEHKAERVAGEEVGEEVHGFDSIAKGSKTLARPTPA